MLSFGGARRWVPLRALGWLVVPLLALGVLAMHGLEPSTPHIPHSTLSTAAHEAVASTETAVVHATAWAPDASSPTHLAWACAWLAAGALLLVTLLAPYGRVASFSADRATRLELVAGRGSRAPPTATRLSLVGVLRR